MLLKSSTSPLPPGPRMPKALQTVGLAARPVPFLADCRRRYGDMFTLDAYPYGKMVYLASAELVREVFTGSPKLLRAGEGNGVLEPILGHRSVLVLDGDEHLAERKALLPHFHGEAVSRYTEVVRDIVREEVATWPRGERFALLARMRRIALEVILRAVLGMGPGEAARQEAIRRALVDLAHMPPHVLLMWMRPELAAVGPWKAHVERRRRAEELLVSEIRRRREAPDLSSRGDVLSLLLRSSGAGDDDELMLHRMLTLLLAGHETSATGLAWTFERLVRHPDVLERTTRAADDDDREWLDAVVREALRVRPVVGEVARVLAEDLAIGGRRLPAGTLILPSILLVQRLDELWPGASRFDPSRHLGDGAGAAPYSWIPYGGGTRRCIGAAFANQEMRLVLQETLRHMTLGAPDGPRSPSERVQLSHITLVPAQRAQVVATPRT